MPMTLAEKRRRAKIASARNELEKAIHAAHRFRKYFKGIKLIGRVDPGFPPPTLPCGGLLRKSRTVSKKQLDQGMAKIERALIKAQRVYDMMLPVDGGAALISNSRPGGGRRQRRPAGCSRSRRTCPASSGSTRFR